MRRRLPISCRFDGSGRITAKEEREMLETKLLLVDDEEAFVAAMEKRLTMRNMKITVAYTGRGRATKTRRRSRH